MTKMKTQKSRPVTKQAVRDMILSKSEQKSIATSTNITPQLLGGISYLSGSAQDDTIDGRTGDVIFPKHIDIRYSFYAVDDVNVFRVIYFQDTMNNSATPSVTDILAAADVNSPYNHILVVQAKRFKILLDQTVGCTPSGYNSQVSVQRIKLKGSIHYDGTTSTVSDASKNAIFRLVISKFNSGNFSAYQRVTFTDA